MSRKSAFRIIIGVITSSLCGVAFAASGTDKVLQSLEKARPKVAVVLAGGGAKGAAHIGVLKALEEMRVPVDILTGTSMGSYVGGLYALGMSADEIESFIYTIDWNSGYRDRVSRSQRRVRDKEFEDRYQLNTDLGVSFGKSKGRQGIVQGQGMLKILREATGNLPPFYSFDDLAIPYRSVATDITNLHEVVIDDGYLVDAMMASMSVPGALPPYELDGQLLVDGGVTNNMPVDVAFVMGADIVIAVDISTDYKQEDDFTTLFTVADQLSNYLVRRSTSQQKELLGDNDFYLRPEVGEMETTEFDRMPDAYQKGYEIAIKHRQALETLALSAADYQIYIDEKEESYKKLRRGVDIVIDEVIINNNTHYGDALIANRLGLEAGRSYTSQELEQHVQDLYALDRFELITYRFDELDGHDVLIVDVEEKSWGPNYLNFRFFLEDDFTTDSQYSIGVSGLFTDINKHGAELRTQFEMGTDKLIQAELFSPFYSSSKWFTSLGVTYSNDKRYAPLSGFDDTSLETTKNRIPITYKDWEGELAFGFQQTLWRQFSLGLRYKYGEGEATSLSGLGDVDFTRKGAFVRYRIDTLDSYSLPNKGWYVDLEYIASKDKMDNNSFLGAVADVDDTVYEFNAKVIGAHTYQRHTLVGNIHLGYAETENDSLPIEPQEIGGFQNLSGIPRNSLIGQNKLFGSLVYRYRWFDNDFGLFTSPFYLGGSVEYGGVWTDPDLAINDAPLYVAGSVFAGIDSPIGPVILGYGQTEDNFSSTYLIIGTTFK